MILFITANDTGVGKTVLTVVWTCYLRTWGRDVVALKPVCSGGRADARHLWQATGRLVPLDEVNPWWFRAAVAPAAAAEKAGVTIRLADVVEHVRRMAARFEVVLVEGAGGLLSPLGTGFDNRDLLRALGAVPVVVLPNRLGVVNQLRLVAEALQGQEWPAPQYVLMSQVRPHPAVRTHPSLLAAHVAPDRIHGFPFLRFAPLAVSRWPVSARVTLQRLTAAVGLWAESATCGASPSVERGSSSR